MSQRTTPSQVQDVLASNWDGSTDVQPFIDLAYPLVDRLAAQDSNSVLTSALLKNIEALLACDYYCMQAPLAEMSKIGQSSESYSKRRTYREQAFDMDASGNLRKIGKVAKVTWLGKRRSQETDYVDRD